MTGGSGNDKGCGDDKIWVLSYNYIFRDISAPFAMTKGDFSTTAQVDNKYSSATILL